MADVMKDTIRRRCPGCFCIWGGTILATPREGGVLCSMVNACLCFCIFYMDMGLSAPQANGHPIFAIQEKALQAQGAMPRVVCKATHLVSPDTAKSGISPNLDRDKMFNDFGGCTTASAMELAFVAAIFFLGVKQRPFADTAGAKSMMWATPCATAFASAFALISCSRYFGG
eukprot:CAMPEP_0114656468 /NCGR_PEP_ID=MMETSP0191-20121206/12391_1 /TAXON_ID=126664 /ORGANISM="Sorites sp." /LENGTH=171 /DNA_ID=CAMNT_0001873747 /DNA_START=67 /DNA_END=583 /DNA_ORIENTATION=+